MKPFEIVPSNSSPLGRARLALEGLSVGDAFGKRFFVSPLLVESLIESRTIPATPAVPTSGTVSPASNFVRFAAYAGAHTVLMNLEAADSVPFSEVIRGDAQTLVPELFA